MSEYKTEISRDEYLKALALYTIAHDHYVKACEFSSALSQIIMLVPERFPGGHVDDAVYSSEKGAVTDFDEALRREGVKVSSE